MLVPHACNPSYSGGRDLDDYGSKSIWANSSQDPTLKILNEKRTNWVIQEVELLPTKH
jgi:hypothetical protein